MKNYNKRTVILTTIVALLPIAAGLILWDQLPDQLAIHFNAANEPDNWASKPFAVVGMPAIIAAIHVLCLFVTAHDPKNQNMTGVMKTLALWICPFISWLCAGMTIGYALNAVHNIGMVVCVFLGILFMVIGNYLPKCTPTTPSASSCPGHSMMRATGATPTASAASASRWQVWWCWCRPSSVSSG